VIEAGLSAEVANGSIQADGQRWRAQHFPGYGLPPFQCHAEKLLAFQRRHQQPVNAGDSINAELRGGDGALLPASGGPRITTNCGGRC
jgi:hypothetical protein